MSKAGLHPSVALLLILCHSSLTPQVGVVGEEPELRALACQQLYVVREVLAHGEALEAVCDQVLGEAQVREQIGMHRHCLPREAGDSVGDALRRGAQNPAHIADTGRGDEQREEPLVGYFSFHRVIDTEGLAGEAAAAALTAEALNGAENSRAVVTVADVPIPLRGG